MKIALLTSGHHSHDDRIYWHFGITLSEHGHDVMIISSKEDLSGGSEKPGTDSFIGDSLSAQEKIAEFVRRLEIFNPETALCSTPLSVYAAGRYRRKAGKTVKIIFDITEWYVSARFLKRYHPLLKWFGFLKLLLTNIGACLQADAFIFGEEYKRIPYRFIFPFKSFRTITYFPDLKYIRFREPALVEKKLRLSYSGEMASEKGFDNFLDVVNRLSDKYKEMTIEVKLIAWFGSESDRKNYEPLISLVRKNVVVSRPGKQKFTDYSGAINDTDIFIELRRKTFENNYSLPIRLFYYAALGRPVIISDLKAVSHDVEIEKFGFTVDPDDSEGIVKIISGYLEDSALYYKHCSKARQLAVEKYNWGNIASQLTDFIGQA